MSTNMQELPQVQPIDQLDNNEFIRLDDQIEDLQSLRSSMLEHGGVNRDIVIAMEDIEEGLITSICPVNGFTRDFSLTNAEVAMEALLGSVKETLVKLFRAFVRAIRRLIEWIVKKGSNNAKRLLVVKTMVRRIKLLSGAVEEVGGVGVKDVEGYNALTNELDNLLKASSMLTMEVLEAGPFHRTLISLGESLPTIVRVLEVKVGILVKASKVADARNSVDALSTLSQLVEVRKPIPVDHLKSVVSRGGVRGSYDNVSDMMDLLTVHQQQLAHDKSTLTQEALLGAIVDAKHDLAERYIKSPDKTMERVMGLMKEIASLERLSLTGTVSDDIVEALRDSLRVVNGEVTAIGKYIEIVVAMGMELHRVTSGLFDAQDKYFRSILKMALMSNDPNTSSAAQKILNTVKGKL